MRSPATYCLIILSLPLLPFGGFLGLAGFALLWISANTRINATAPPAQAAISGTLLSGRRKAARPVVPAGSGELQVAAVHGGVHLLPTVRGLQVHFHIVRAVQAR